MQESPFTLAGIRRLAEIARDARNSRVLTEFEELSGIPISTIRRLEAGGNKTIEYVTLQRLAPHTPYTAQELLAIGTESENMNLREYRLAEDVLPSAEQLPPAELARLIELLAIMLRAKLLE